MKFSIERQLQRQARKSFHSLTKIMTPIPLVKPTMTGSGINLMRLPSLIIPIKSRMNPANNVATCKPSIPYCAVILARITTKHPWGRQSVRGLPPKRHNKTSDDGRIQTLCWRNARSNCKRHCQRQRNHTHNQTSNHIWQPVFKFSVVPRDRLR